jgi:type I restriction enzyme R subunit
VSGLDDAAQQRSFDRHCETVRTLLDNLSDKANVPQVRECLELIDEARRDAWWTDVTPEQIEQLRRQLRNVVGFADRQQREILYTNFRDQLEEIQEIATPLGATGYSYERYREKVSAFIRDREHHVAIAKLKRNRSLTDDDLTALDALLFDEGMEIVESRERFETLLESGSEPLSLSSFIRQVVGLDRDAVRSAFEQYLDGSRFSANQIRFVEQVIDWLTANGSLPVAELYKPPFTDYAPGGFDEIFTDHDADTICELMRRFDVA